MQQKRFSPYFLEAGEGAPADADCPHQCCRVKRTDARLSAFRRAISMMLVRSKPGNTLHHLPSIQQKQLVSLRSTSSPRLLLRPYENRLRAACDSFETSARPAEVNEAVSAPEDEPSTSYADRLEADAAPTPPARPWHGVLGKLAKAAAVGSLCFALVGSDIQLLLSLLCFHSTSIT